MDPFTGATLQLVRLLRGVSCVEGRQSIMLKLPDTSTPLLPAIITAAGRERPSQASAEEAQPPAPQTETKFHMLPLAGTRAVVTWAG